MRHPRLQQFDKQLKSLFGEIDDYLEEKYGKSYTLHPSRPERGATGNKSHDGLFNVGASFSPGFGSKIGRGYVVQVEMVTLEDVPAERREAIEDEVVTRIEERLPRFFPDRRLSVDRDRNVYKIHGDLSIR